MLFEEKGKEERRREEKDVDVSRSLWAKADVASLPTRHHRDRLLQLNFYPVFNENIIPICRRRPVLFPPKIKARSPMSGSHRSPPQLSPETLHALTHLLTNPATATAAPDLHSQLLISTLLHPSVLPHYYPPLLSSSASRHLGHGLRLFLRRISPFRTPTTSWRSKCPYQQPPPAVLARGLEVGRWGDEDRRDYVRARLRRKRLGSDVHPLVPFLIPNLLLFSLLFWDPIIPYRD